MQKTISLIIPCKDASETIGNVLDTVLSYKYQPDEIIIIDDGSTDNTLEILSSYDITYKPLFKSFGAAYCRNLGAQIAKGDYLVFLDSDVIPKEDWIEVIIKNLSQDIGGIAGKYEQSPTDNLIFNEVYNLQEEYLWALAKDKQITPALYGGICAFKKEAFFSKDRSFKEEALFYQMASGEDNFILDEILRSHKVIYVKEFTGKHITDFSTRFRERSINQSYSRATNIIFRLRENGNDKKRYYKNEVIDSYFISHKIMAEALFLTSLIFLYKENLLIAMALLSFASSLFLYTLYPLFNLMGRLSLKRIFYLVHIQLLQQIYWNIGVLKAVFAPLSDNIKNKYRLFRSALNYYSKDDLSKVFLFVTSKCNFTCSWCLDKSRADENINVSLGGVLQPENIKKMCRSTKRRIPFVTITGGEPFLRSDIDELIYYLYRGFQTTFVTISTNGSFPEKTCEMIKRILLSCPFLTLNIQLTVYSTEEVHDKVRGGRDSYQKIIELAQMMREIQKESGSKRLILSTATNLDFLNIKDYQEISKDIERNIEPDQQIFSLIRDTNRLISPVDSSLKYFNEINEHIKNVNHKTRLSFLQTFYISLFEKTQQVYVDIRKFKNNLFECGGGKNFITIYEDGKVSVCENRRDLEMGNLMDFDFNLDVLLESTKARQAHLTQVCQKCTCDWPCAINEHLMTNHQFQLNNIFLSARKYLTNRLTQPNKIKENAKKEVSNEVI